MIAEDFRLRPGPVRVLATESLAVPRAAVGLVALDRNGSVAAVGHARHHTTGGHDRALKPKAAACGLVRQCRRICPANLYVTRTYERAIRKLLSEDSRREMEMAIVTRPEAAPVIRGTGGIRKLRWAGSGKGKRGGIRAIYFWHAGPDAVYMLTAYAKADRDDPTAADRKALMRLVTTIERETRG